MFQLDQTPTNMTMIHLWKKSSSGTDMIDPSEASTQIKDFVTKVYQIRQEVEHLFDYFQLSDAAQNLSLDTS